MNEVPPTNSGTQKPRNLLFWIVAFIVLIFVTFVTYKVGSYVRLIYNVKMEADQALNEADGGFKKARETINPEQLRAWALEEISKEQSANTNFIIPNSEIPIYIRNLYSYPPTDIEVETNTVAIWWGGGFFHWMIDIGSTNYIETTGATNDYTTVEWVPGIYYSREDTRHPFK